MAAYRLLPDEYDAPAALSGTMSGTSDIVDVGLKPAPYTFTLKSSDGTRKIELSTDGGTEYFQPTYDVTSATMLVVAADTRISHVKFTGVANDTWSVR